MSLFRKIEDDIADARRRSDAVALGSLGLLKTEVINASKESGFTGEIDDALLRVADKTYGYCERCFQPIPKPRLRALPYARLCVACKSGGLSRR